MAARWQQTSSTALLTSLAPLPTSTTVTSRRFLCVSHVLLRSPAGIPLIFTRCLCGPAFLAEPRSWSIISRLCAVPAAGTGSQVYLWYKRGDEAPIVALEVLYNDEPAPAGYVKASKDLGKGTDGRVYLAFRRAVEGETDAPLPIVSVRILGADAKGAAAVSGPV